MIADIVAPPTREQIQQAEALLNSAPSEAKLDIEPAHTFGPGFYCRTISVPAGAWIIGKVHATEHVFMLTRGEMAVASEHGRQIVKAPYQIVSAPGVKRVGFAITACDVTNVHITPETDMARLEAELIVPEALEYSGAPAVGE